ncbi:hypothetical protein [Thermocrinis sp.]|jgi:hypothetical protein|uniref:hypothetical protein n=1 Tax=Thermocrinis sp. TaxID=2024383 RepID=UPI003BFBADF6
MRRVYFAVLVFFLIVGCTSVVNQTPTFPTRGAPYVVPPFENYAETPYAGYRGAYGRPYAVPPFENYAETPYAGYRGAYGRPYAVPPFENYAETPYAGYRGVYGNLYAVLPFENYTETPYAGYRVASILEGVLASKGYSLIPRVWSIKEKEPTEEEIKKLKESAIKNGARYIVYGSVNEFRYKTGLDGEPAVSITVLIYDARENKVVRNVTVSGSGWVHESLGTLAQKLLNRAF